MISKSVEIVCDICGKTVEDFDSYVEVRAEELGLYDDPLFPNDRRCIAAEMYHMHTGCFSDVRFVIGHVGKNLRIVAEDLRDESQASDSEQVD